jgi:hypothetical protein
VRFRPTAMGTSAVVGDLVDLQARAAEARAPKRAANEKIYRDKVRRDRLQRILDNERMVRKWFEPFDDSPPDETDL